MAVFRAFRFLPLAFIAEAVPKSLGRRVKCQPQKSQITSGEVRLIGWNTASQFFRQNRDDERARIVLCGTPFWMGWQGEYCMLCSCSLLGDAVQMIQFYGRK